MDFTGIGKIGAFARQKNLIYAANYKIKTGQSIVDGSGRLTFSKTTIFNSVQYANKTSNTTADQTRLASIKQKLKSGKKLSESEMSYLREKDEKLYKKAKYAEEAREELKSELQAAKTKQEARQAVMRMTAKIAADCSADLEALQGGGSMNLGASMNVGGDSAIGMDTGAENFSNDEISNFTTSANSTSENSVATSKNFSSGEISNFTTSENSTSENFVATSENFSNGEISNVTTSANSTSENSDTEIDILDKYIYAIRAIQDEWLEFMKSDKYKDMAEDIFEAAEIKVTGRNPKISNGQLIDALFAYKKSMAYEIF